MIVTGPFQLEIFYNSMILHITPSSTIKHAPPSNSRLKAHNYGVLGETLFVEKALKLWSQLTQALQAFISIKHLNPINQPSSPAGDIYYPLSAPC